MQIYQIILIVLLFLYTVIQNTIIRYHQLNVSWDKYKQGICKLIYALSICRSDIYFLLIKLTRPSCIHFNAVKVYMHTSRKPEMRKSTTGERRLVWIFHLLLTQFCCQTTQIIPHDSKTTTELDGIDVQVDVSYASDSAHIHSIKGTIARLAGGTILYKIKFKDVIVISSTEAEFIAGCEGGKNYVYL